MKKILFTIIVMLFSFNIFSQTQIAKFRFEQTGTDTTGTYVLAPTGTQQYSNTIFHDDLYSWKGTGSTYFLMPTNLKQAIKDTTIGYTFHMWIYCPADTGAHGILYNASGLDLTVNGSANVIRLVWSGINDFTYNYATEKETWISIGITYNKITGDLIGYKNNVLAFTRPSAVDMFGSVATAQYFGVALQYFTGGYIDNFIVCDGVATSFPPVDTFHGIYYDTKIIYDKVAY